MRQEKLSKFCCSSRRCAIRVSIREQQRDPQGVDTGVTWASVRDTDPCLSFLGRRCPIDLGVEVLSGWGSSGSGSYGSGVLTEWIGPAADGMRIDRISVGLDPEEDSATS